MPLELVPCTRDEALAFIDQHHRTHGRPKGYLFAIATALDGVVRGVIVVGRPVARMLADGFTAEVIRCCTDGTKNACSKLYSAAWRAAQRLGYRKLITYTLPEEGGASLRAAGWTCVGKSRGGSWDRATRPRVDKHPTQAKLRWESGGAR